jgi:hypothetical protein
VKAATAPFVGWRRSPSAANDVGSVETASLSFPTPLDPEVAGRAESAFKFTFAQWQRLIEATLRDRGLSPDQRAAAVVSLRYYQLMEAQGARRRVLEGARRPKQPRSKNNAGQKPDHT